MTQASKRERDPQLPNDGPTQPEPFQDCEAVDAGTAKRPHATDPHRWADGTMRAGSTGSASPSFKTGRYVKQPPALPPVQGDPADPPAATARLRRDLEADPIDSAIRITVQRGVELEAIGRVMVQELVGGGCLTSRGRPRSLVGAYLNVIAAQDRVLQRLLGLQQQRVDRKTNVLDLPFSEYLEQQSTE